MIENTINLCMNKFRQETILEKNCQMQNPTRLRAESDAEHSSNTLAQ